MNLLPRIPQEVTLTRKTMFAILLTVLSIGLVVYAAASVYNEIKNIDKLEASVAALTAEQASTTITLTTNANTLNSVVQYLQQPPAQK